MWPFKKKIKENSNYEVKVKIIDIYITFYLKNGMKFEHKQFGEAEYSDFIIIRKNAYYPICRYIEKDYYYPNKNLMYPANLIDYAERTEIEREIFVTVDLNFNGKIIDYN